MVERVTMVIVMLALALSALAVAGYGSMPHDPISILADDAFTTENGVIAGKGTADSPYVIAGWTIEARTGVGIRIEATSAHVLIRDCKIAGDRRRGIGVLVAGTAPIRVAESDFIDLRTGVFVYRNPRASVDANRFTNCHRGVEASESDGVVVRGNTFVDPREHGAFLWRCHEAVVECNVASNGQNGVYLDSCHRAQLARNHAEGSQRGMFLWDCFDCTVIGNEFRGCDLALALVHTSERNVVFHNLFIGNVRAATCDEANNDWDDGYPSGGNYWGDGTAVDVRCGPSQEEPGSDGIADSARIIPFAGVDRYPLIAPPPADAP
jgi:nitrous oxidase accessory protein NosD